MKEKCYSHAVQIIQKFWRKKQQQWRYMLKQSEDMWSKIEKMENDCVVCAIWEAVAFLDGKKGTNENVTAKNRAQWL